MISIRWRGTNSTTKMALVSGLAHTTTLHSIIHIWVSMVTGSLSHVLPQSSDSHKRRATMPHASDWDWISVRCAECAACMCGTPADASSEQETRTNPTPGATQSPTDRQTRSWAQLTHNDLPRQPTHRRASHRIAAPEGIRCPSSSLSIRSQI